jgi:2-methylcitrate dehydratase PrpD
MFHDGTLIRSEALEELGQSYALVSDGIRIKPYPCGGLTHQAIDAALDYRKQGITAETVESIDVDVMEHTYARIACKIPQNGIQGKFCMGYLLSRAIIDGKVCLQAFTDSAVRDQNILKLAEKLTCGWIIILRPTIRKRPCRVTVRLRKIQTFCRQVQHAKV